MNRWSVLGLVYLMMLAFVFALQSIPPLVGQLLAALELSHAQVGLLMSLFALPGIILSIPGGHLVDRQGVRVTGLASLGCLLVGTLLVATLQGYGGLLAGRLTAGVGSVLILVILPQMIIRHFAGRELGLAFGIFHTAMPIGTILCLNTFGVMGARYGWQRPLWIPVGIAAAALAAFAATRVWRDEAESEPRGTAKDTDSQGGMPFGIWLVGMAWMWFNAAVISFLTFGPDYFSSKGHTVARAGLLASFLMWGSLGLGPLVGRAVDRYGGKTRLLMAGGVSLAAIFLLLPLVSGWDYPLMVAMGVAVALVPTPAFALPADFLPRERTGTAFGIMNACNNGGIVFGPFLAGALRDFTRGYGTSFFLFALFSALVTVMAGLLASRYRLR